MTKWSIFSWTLNQKITVINMLVHSTIPWHWTYTGKPLEMSSLAYLWSYAQWKCHLMVHLTSTCTNHAQPEHNSAAMIVRTAQSLWLVAGHPQPIVNNLQQTWPRIWSSVLHSSRILRFSLLLNLWTFKHFSLSFLFAYCYLYLSPDHFKQSYST